MCQADPGLERFLDRTRTIRRVLGILQSKKGQQQKDDSKQEIHTKGQYAPPAFNCDKNYE